MCSWLSPPFLIASTLVSQEGNMDVLAEPVYLSGIALKGDRYSWIRATEVLAIRLSFSQRTCFPQETRLHCHWHEVLCLQARASLEVHWAQQEGELSASPVAHSLAAAAFCPPFPQKYLTCKTLLLRTWVLAPFYYIHWHYREPEPKLEIYTKRARELNGGMQDSLGYFWLLTEIGSAVIQTQPILLRYWPFGPWVVGQSAWEGSLCKARLQDSTVTTTEQIAITVR